jgi:hypothetical protein
MLNGSATRYAGNRGATWSIRNRDADRRRVSETLGREADGGCSCRRSTSRRSMPAEWVGGM